MLVREIASDPQSALSRRRRPLAEPGSLPGSDLLDLAGIALQAFHEREHRLRCRRFRPLPA